MPRTMTLDEAAAHILVYGTKATMTTQVLPSVLYVPRLVEDPDATEQEIAQQIGLDALEPRVASMGGRSYKVPRLEAWYGPHKYHFNGHTFPARPLPPALLALKVRLECWLSPAIEFQGCLVNVYRDGQDSVAWHSDDEPDMGDPIVASLSFGAARDILFRAKNPRPVLSSALLPNRAKVRLEHGSLLLMGRGVQGLYEHSLPKRANTGRRINLTFRSRG